MRNCLHLFLLLQLGILSWNEFFSKQYSSIAYVLLGWTSFWKTEFKVLKIHMSDVI